MNRVNYGTNICGLAKELELDYAEAEFNLRLTEHFERNIRHAVYGQQIKNTNTLLKLLNDYDNEDHRQKIKKVIKIRLRIEQLPYRIQFVQVALNLSVNHSHGEGEI